MQYVKSGTLHTIHMYVCGDDLTTTYGHFFLPESCCDVSLTRFFSVNILHTIKIEGGSICST